MQRKRPADRLRITDCAQILHSQGFTQRAGRAGKEVLDLQDGGCPCIGKRRRAMPVSGQKSRPSRHQGERNRTGRGGGPGRNEVRNLLHRNRGIRLQQGGQAGTRGRVAPGRGMLMAWGQTSRFAGKPHLARCRTAQKRALRLRRDQCRDTEQDPELSHPYAMISGVPDRARWDRGEPRAAIVHRAGHASASRRSSTEPISWGAGARTWLAIEPNSLQFLSPLPVFLGRPANRPLGLWVCNLERL